MDHSHDDGMASTGASHPISCVYFARNSQFKLKKMGGGLAGWRGDGVVVGQRVVLGPGEEGVGGRPGD